MRPLSAAEVEELATKGLVVVDNWLPSASVQACSAELLAGVSAGDFTKTLQVLTKDQSALLFHQQRMVEGVGCRACPPAMARRPHWEGWEGMV